MGGNAFAKKYNISRVDNKALESIDLKLKQMFAKDDQLEWAYVGNTEHVFNRDSLDTDTGDVDVIINMDKKILKAFLESRPEFVALKAIGNNVLTVYEGFYGNFYQVDFMTTKNVKLGKWLMKGNPYGCKGVMRNLFLCFIIKQKNNESIGNNKITYSIAFPGVFTKTELTLTNDNDVLTYRSNEILAPRAICIELGIIRRTSYYIPMTYEMTIDSYVDINLNSRSDIAKAEQQVDEFYTYIKSSHTYKQSQEEGDKAIEYYRNKIATRKALLTSVIPGWERA